MTSLHGADDPQAAVQNLTLPELLSAAESARRRVIEQLQYDVLPRARKLATGEDPDPVPLLQSHDFTVRLMLEWDVCWSAIQQRFEDIASGD